MDTGYSGTGRDYSFRVCKSNRQKKYGCREICIRCLRKVFCSLDDWEYGDTVGIWRCRPIYIYIYIYIGIWGFRLDGCAERKGERTRGYHKRLW